MPPIGCCTDLTGVVEAAVRFMMFRRRCYLEVLRVWMMLRFLRRMLCVAVVLCVSDLKLPWSIIIIRVGLVLLMFRIETLRLSRRLSLFGVGLSR